MSDDISIMRRLQVIEEAQAKQANELTEIKAGMNELNDFIQPVANIKILGVNLAQAAKSAMDATKSKVYKMKKD